MRGMKQRRLVTTLVGDGKLEIEGARFGVRYDMKVCRDFEVSPAGAAVPVLKSGRGLVEGLEDELVNRAVREAKPLWLEMEDGTRALIQLEDANGNFAVSELVENAG